MNKALIGTFAGLALVAGSVGSTALATNGKVEAGAQAEVRTSFLGRIFDRGEKGANSDEFKKADESRQDNRGTKEDRGFHKFFGMARVTAITDGTITAEGKGDTTWTIQTDSETAFYARGEKDGDINSIEIGSLVAFKGDITSDGNSKMVDATAVHYWNGADKEKVRAAGGTIESINETEGTVVLDTPRRGEVTVDINSDTTIKEDGEVASFSDLYVGAKLRVRGMWDSVSNVFTAVKVKIVG